jgi:Leucine-rich repeat (LRR) protein
LKDLNLSTNRISSLKGLAGLKGLKDLALWDNPNLTKAQIAQLQKALPKCEITSNPTK